MALKAKHTEQSINDSINAFLEGVEQMKIDGLMELGEICVKHARTITVAQGGFQDQTGNLRSSIGYAVFQDGVEVYSKYEVASGTNAEGESYSGDEGAKVGQALAQEVGEASVGLVLVVTAGMSYAIYVEKKGRDVLTSAEHLAQQEKERIMSQISKAVRDTFK